MTDAARALYDQLDNRYLDLSKHREREIALIAAALREAEAEGLEAGRVERDIPEINDFLKGIQIEASHQRERWGLAHDEEKTDADWFWLVGYLAGKALHLPEKRLHHIITTAAALANWHAQVVRRAGKEA